jgi:hypothetical protein
MYELFKSNEQDESLALVEGNMDYEVVSKCKIQTNFIDYQSSLCARPLSEETKQRIDALAERASELIKEHQFNFNNH